MHYFLLDPGLNCAEHGHVHGFVSGQVYDSIQSPKILRGMEHAQTVCTMPFLLPSKGLGTRLAYTLRQLVLWDTHTNHEIWRFPVWGSM